MTRKRRPYRARLATVRSGDVEYLTSTDRVDLVFRRKYARGNATLRLPISQALSVALGQPGARAEFQIGDATCTGGISGDGVWFDHPTKGRCVVPFRTISEIFFGQTFLA